MHREEPVKKMTALVMLTLLLVMTGSAQQVFDTNNKQRIRVTPVATGLVHPWSIAFLPDGRTMLVAERFGRLRIIRNGVLEAKPVWEAPKPPRETSDLLHSVVIHPRFAENRFVYISYPKFGDRGSTLAVSRGRLGDESLSDVQEIFVADAWETSGNLAGRMRCRQGLAPSRRRQHST